MRGRPILWAVAGVGLLAGIANRLLPTWIYNRMAVDAAIAPNTITDPVLTFVSIVGAVAAAAAIIFPAPQRAAGQTSASGTPGTGPACREGRRRRAAAAARGSGRARCGQRAVQRGVPGRLRRPLGRH